MAPTDTPTDDTKACPFCGEAIKAVAIRCKHCQADLTAKAPVADFDRGADASAQSSKEEDFEQRFLEFAYETDETLNAISVAHALKLPISFCDAQLESLAAGDVLRREVDDEGNVFFEHGPVPAPLGIALAQHQGVVGEVQEIVDRGRDGGRSDRRAHHMWPTSSGIA